LLKNINGEIQFLRGKPYFFIKKNIFVRQVAKVLWCYGNGTKNPSRWIQTNEISRVAKKELKLLGPPFSNSDGNLSLT
jgi:hypothetical protein